MDNTLEFISLDTATCIIAIGTSSAWSMDVQFNNQYGEVPVPITLPDHVSDIASNDSHHNDSGCMSSADNCSWEILVDDSSNSKKSKTKSSTALNGSSLADDHKYDDMYYHKRSIPLADSSSLNEMDLTVIVKDEDVLPPSNSNNEQCYLVEGCCTTDNGIQSKDQQRQRNLFSTTHKQNTIILENDDLSIGVSMVEHDHGDTSSIHTALTDWTMATTSNRPSFRDILLGSQTRNGEVSNNTSMQSSDIVRTKPIQVPKTFSKTRFVVVKPSPPEAISNSNKNYNDDEYDEYDGIAASHYYNTKEMGKNGHANGLKLRPDEIKRKQYSIKKRNDQRCGIR